MKMGIDLTKYVPDQLFWTVAHFSVWKIIDEGQEILDFF